MATAKTACDPAELRQRAEKEMETKAERFAKLSGMSIEKIEYLVHNLQVHQIELKMQNEELCRLREELEISRDKYCDLYEQAPVGYLMMNQKGIITEANLTLAAMLGIERKTLIGTPVTKLIIDDDQDIFYRHRQELIETQSPQSCELRLVKKDGKAFYVGLECVIAKNTDGDAELIRGAIMNITERRLAQKANTLLEAQLRQAQKMESVGTLAGGIAHDFNNILGIVLGNAELAMDAVPEWNCARNHLEQICQAALRAKKIVQQLLSFSRQDENKLKPMNIGPVVADALKLMRSSIPAQIEIQADIPEQCDSVLADATQIHQVVINLCGNAADAMEENGGVLTVSMTHTDLSLFEAQKYLNLKPGRYVKLTIGDTGCGMSAQTLERIYDPYFTTKAIGKGTGIGLAVVHSIMLQIGGAMYVASTLGQGSSFTLLFPITRQIAESVTETSIKPARGTERILLVDDEPALTMLGQKMLEQLGYTVEAVNTPLDAMAIFQSDPDRFDLVISDMSMPGMTGDRLAQNILQVRQQVPIIICTGYSERILPDKVQAVGARSILMKPYRLIDLASIVRKVLDNDR